MKFSDLLTEEDIQRAEAFATEAALKAKQVEALFNRDTRGMMQFMYVMGLLRKLYPAVADAQDGNERIAEWLAVGAPEEVSKVPDMFIKMITEKLGLHEDRTDS